MHALLQRLAFGLALLTGPAAQAELSVLHSFAGSDGDRPTGLLLTSDGALYGTTLSGGTARNCDPTGSYTGCGTLFRIGADGAFHSLVSFDGRHGSFPEAPPSEDAAHAIFGVTNNGGTDSDCLRGCGTAYRLTEASSHQMLASFDGSAGVNPSSALLPVSPGTFYGAAFAGGASTACLGGCGTLFRIDAQGKATKLAQFDRRGGAGPLGAMALGANGTVYGTTYFGGPRPTGPCAGYGCGTVFSLSANPSPGKPPVLSLLHAFTGADGTGPRGLVAGPDGAFYGATASGGNGNNGTVYRIAADGGFSILTQFHGRDGSIPVGRVAVAPDGTVYGTTYYGGINGVSGYGVIFRIVAGAPQVLEYFDWTQRGANPQDLLIGPNGMLYGVTAAGGPGGAGVVFRLDPASTKPDPFAFATRLPVARGSIVTSESVVLSGFGMPAPISISGGQYRVRTPGGAWSDWTDVAGQLSPGKLVQVRLTASASPRTVVSATLTVGGVAGTFAVPTR